MRCSISDEEVEREIARLLEDEDVLLAKKEEQIRFRRRQYLYKLRGLKRHGAELRTAGLSIDILEGMGDD